MTKHTQHHPPSGHNSEQEPSGGGHRTRKTTHPVGTPVNGSQVVKDTARTTQHTAWAHQRMGGKWHRTPHTQSKALRGHTGEQEPRRPGAPTTKSEDGAVALVTRSQVVQDTAHPKQHTEWAHQ